MFTGLIEEIGRIAAVEQSTAGSRLSIRAARVMENIKLGDSVAIDGACTTVIGFDTQQFTIEASPETLARTTFGTYTPGTRVNLERPLTPASRIGGHYVTGHIDGLATLKSKEPAGISQILTFETNNSELAQYWVEKGSVAVSGISLTVNEVVDNQFKVAIIPHTFAQTTLGDLNIGDAVNIETDLLGKYVYKFLMPNSNKNELDNNFLITHGFVKA